MKWLFVMLMLLSGCTEGPVGPKGDKGTTYIGQQQLTSWGYSVKVSDVAYRGDHSYIVTVADPRFCLGYWYDVWIVGIDAQFRVSNFIIEPGMLIFNYAYDLTGYALLIITDKQD